MAQREQVRLRQRHHGRCVLGRRGGISASRGVALGCLAAAFLAVAIFFIVRGTGGGFSLKRSDATGSNAASLSSTSDLAHSDNADASDASDVSSSTVSNKSAESAQKCMVHVDGAVSKRGVYELTEGSRIQDAVDAAGGLSKDADTTTINLAMRVSDGMKVYVPAKGEALPVSAADGAGADAPVAAQSASAGPININTATAEELTQLPGVGEKTAENILEERETNGPFSSPEDLMRVSGIGEKKFAKLKDEICV